MRSTAGSDGIVNKGYISNDSLVKGRLNHALVSDGDVIGKPQKKDEKRGQPVDKPKNKDEERVPQKGYKIEKKTKYYVYISHFMSAWGDRMWTFAVGLFLISLAPESLQLPAIYGFSSGGAVLLFAGLVGYWVDNTPRLTAARLSLIVQNLLVIMCSVVVFFVFLFEFEKPTAQFSEYLIKGSHAVIIFISILSNLASIARKIAIERDWVVEICGRDKDMLASMTSKLRAIDLFTQILAPVLTGQIMTWSGKQYGAVLIGGWNFLSVFAEYFLILKVYNQVPALKSKMYKKRKDKGPVTIEPADEENGEKEETLVVNDGEQLKTEEPGKEEITQDVKQDGNTKITEPPPKEEKELTGCLWLLSKMFFSFISLYKGYKTFFKYDVALAGLGLSFLYMTVMGFDNITVGYAYSQGLTEAILGGLQAGGAIFGILGTFLYPKIRLKIGLERTGLMGLGSEILCLCLCVASVWTPGSPFDLFGSPSLDPPVSQSCSNSSAQTNATSSVTHMSISVNSSDFQNNTYSHITTAAPCNTTVSSEKEADISVWLLMAGIITARSGLWISDLTITQLFLQSVREEERGIVSSMQNSMNKLMDMLKFVMVIVAPYPHQFGLLVIISFAFICMAWVLYATYCRKARGHFFHFEKVAQCVDSKNNNLSPQTEKPDTS